MTNKLTVDLETCTFCGLCVQVCPEGMFEQQGEKSPPHVVAGSKCIACGHCLAACPVGSLEHTDFPAGSIRPLAQKLLPDAARLMEALRARRSIREFKDQPLERGDLEQVIEAARLAPSAKNCQSTEFVVVQDRANLRRLTTLTADFLAKTSRMLRRPVLGRLIRLFGGDRVETVIGMLDEFDQMVGDVEAGRDPVLCEPAAVIIFHGRKGAAFSEVNANLGVQNAALMAQCLGLGCFYTGYLVAACGRGRAIQDLLGVPRSHAIHGGLALGVPRVKYRSWPSRRPAKVTWV